VLGIGEARLARVHREKTRVEQVYIRQQAVNRDITEVRQERLRHAGGAEFSRAEAAQTFPAGAEMTPELIDVGGLRKPSGHADYSNPWKFFRPDLETGHG
jgi:hypothetical protein